MVALLIYYLLIIAIFFINGIVFKVEDPFRKRKIFLLIICLLMILIQGLRSTGVGIDLLGHNSNTSTGYINAFRYAKYYDFFSGEKLLNYEIGYSLYTKLFSIINVSDNVFLFIVSATVLIPIFIVWWKYSKYPMYSVLIYIALGFYTFSFSGLRQSIAIAIIVFSFKYVVTRKKYKFIVVVLIAMSFHKTACFFFLAYPLYFIVFKRVHYLIIGLLYSLVFIFRRELFSFGYKLIFSQPVKSKVNDAYTMLLVMILVVILALLLGNRINAEPRFNAYKNYMLVAIFIQLFASQSMLIMRLGYYYYVFISLLIPEVLSVWKNDKGVWIAKYILILLLLFFYQKTTGSGYLNVSPYMFFWQG